MQDVTFDSAFVTTVAQAQWCPDCAELARCQESLKILVFEARSDLTIDRFGGYKMS